MPYCIVDKLTDCVVQAKLPDGSLVSIYCTVFLIFYFSSHHFVCNFSFNVYLASAGGGEDCVW